MSITGVSQTSTQLPSNTTFQQRNDAFNSLDQALSGGDLSSAQSAFATLQSLGPKDGKGPPPGDGNDPMAKDMAAVSSALQSGDLSGAQTAFAKLKSDMAAHRGHHHKPQDADGDAAATATSTTASTTSTSGVIDTSNGLDITA
ncbi:MAG: hypothetical protein JSR86_05520 [Proteobacteria bacterium]|nr:hypothetical protein [Pseudomonadota bacterium]